MTRKLKIVFFAVDAVGPQNACVGIGQVLLKRGHQVYIFAKTDNRLNGKFSEYGFTPLPLKSEDEKELTDEEAIEEQKKETEYFVKMGLFENVSHKEKIRTLMEGFISDEYVEMYAKYEVQIQGWLEKVKPDLLIVDSIGLTPPSLLHAGIPWILIYCSNPLGAYNHPDLPPALSGFSMNVPREEWEDFRKVYEEFHNGPIIKGQQTLLKKFGYPLPAEPKLDLLSPYLNIIQFPEELDYHNDAKLPGKFARVDATCRQELGGPFEVPVELKNKMKAGDKLVYLSLGSIGTSNVPLMNRLMGIFAKTPHFYIVSKGVFHEQIKLADNMWGDRYVPQTKILPIVDAAVIHGGNNSLTEAFTFGTPCVVMPLFYDQPDNGARVVEKGYGVMVNPYNFQDQEVIDAVNKVLTDEELRAKMKKAAERIQSSKSKEKACDAIEKVAEEFYKK